MYADVIVGLSIDKLDRAFTYKIPDSMKKDGEDLIGTEVIVPFGKGGREIRGFLIEIKDHTDVPETLLKEIIRKAEKSIPVERKLIRLAAYLRKNFGGTMNDALRTVIQIPKKIERQKRRWISLAVEKEEAEEVLRIFLKKKYTAKARVVKELLLNESFCYEIFRREENVSFKVLEGLEKDGILTVKEEQIYRQPFVVSKDKNKRIILNEDQTKAKDEILLKHKKGNSQSYLLFGVTGSGKTEVYMDIIEEVIGKGEQVIFLIPEISLTYQMVERLSSRFGDRISMMNSRMSAGEKYDQYVRARNGEIDIIVGPRSALFIPFENLGLIIVDEEHSESYRSSKTPCYHAREVAMERARMEGADLILGSATPSLSVIKMAGEGKIQLLRLKKRPKGVMLPQMEIVDLREELKNGNRSIFSLRLKELLRDRLEKGEQTMLFINRRGYAGFVSCRSCGEPMKCPSCDVSMTFHKPDRLLCHYCGFEKKMPETCPSCSSPYIKTFGLGTEQVEELVKKEFPQASVIRMDADTTGRKHGHEEILTAFKEKKADILVGTQMIVKGHDFPNVTLVGILAADLSLFSNDYRASEQTYQLLVQAAGRAGRGKMPGNVVIQTYKPEHYTIQAAATGDYKSFYEKEMRFRHLADYPPVREMLAIILAGTDSIETEKAAVLLEKRIRTRLEKNVTMNPPVWAVIPKVNNVYRKILYLKAKEKEALIRVKTFAEEEALSELYKKVSIRFEFSA